MNIDIARGQMVVMNGHTCIVRHLSDLGAFLEYPNGEERFEYFDDIADQNPDLVLEEDYGYDSYDSLDDEEDW